MFTSIHSRRRRRKMRDGRTVILKRVVLSWRDPRTRKRKQRFYATRAEAEAARTKLLETISRGGAAPSRSSLTVGDAIEYWLEAKAPSVRPETVAGYRLYSSHAEPLFPILVSDLTTADIRRWYSGVASRFTAARAKSYLASALALAAEDFNLRPPPMPTNLGRNGHRPKKAMLTVEQACELIAFCRHHPRGIYVALPFLTGLRVGEALALLWSEVDLNDGFIRVCRTQALDGSLHETTKTSSSTRVVPIGGFLRAWLREWQEQLPRSPDLTSRVLPAPRGGPLVYYSFYKRVWSPLLAQANIPFVSPHSSRHFYISCLQEVGAAAPTASWLVGHSDPSVTLGVYSHSLSDGRQHVNALETRLLAGPPPRP